MTQPNPTRSPNATRALWQSVDSNLADPDDAERVPSTSQGAQMSAAATSIPSSLDGSPPRKTRIVHVAESFGGGVAGAIKDYALNHSDAEHVLIYATRADAPVSESDLAGFASSHRMPHGHLARIRFVRRYLNGDGPVIVHAHSSYAGAYVRLAAVRSTSCQIVYTPHCYSFERRDISWAARSAFWIMESILAANTSVFACCSVRELELSRWRFVRSRRVLVPNVAPDVSSVGQPAREARSTNLRLAGSGRLSRQKDPLYFATAVQEIRRSGFVVDAIWIGGGNENIARKLRESGVVVTGWLDRPEVLSTLATADVYLHSAAWDGFPLAVLESAALGVPTIVRKIGAFHGMDLPAVVDAPEDVASTWTSMEDVAYRERISRVISERLSCYSVDEQRLALARCYETKSKVEVPR